MKKIGWTLCMEQNKKQKKTQCKRGDPPPKKRYALEIMADEVCNDIP